MNPNPENRIAKKVLLVGWDAADWKVINPLVDAGRMPNVKKMMEHGVMGNIATLHPVLSPMLWTSIATGKRPYKHGIYGFYEPTPDGLNVQPITNLFAQNQSVLEYIDSKRLEIKRRWLVAQSPRGTDRRRDGFRYVPQKTRSRLAYRKSCRQVRSTQKVRRTNWPNFVWISAKLDWPSYIISSQTQRTLTKLRTASLPFAPRSLPSARRFIQRRPI